MSNPLIFNRLGSLYTVPKMVSTKSRFLGGPNFIFGRQFKPTDPPPGVQDHLASYYKLPATYRIIPSTLAVCTGWHMTNRFFHEWALQFGLYEYYFPPIAHH